jgi:glycosyltransferase involved in cell wall biosynthesis
MAQQAIRDFQRQTWQDRELIIVQDSSHAFHEELKDYIQQFPEERIRLYFIEKPLSLGELRNISVEKASGSYICQWDDDDRYHPQRLEIQFELLQQEDSDFCFLTDQLHWYQEKNWWFWDDWQVETFPMNLIQGTILGKKELLGEYPALDRGEDTPVIVDIAERGLKISQLKNHGYLYIYTYNGNNVWDYQHHAAISAWKRYGLERLEHNQAVLSQYLAGYRLGINYIIMPHDAGVLKLFINVA